MTGSGVDYSRLLERAAIEVDDAVLALRFRGASVLVTGAGGSIASGLIDVLQDLGVERVVCVESHEPSLFRLGVRARERGRDGTVVLRLGDVRDTARLAQLIKHWHVDAVFHLAAYKHVPLAEENCDQVVAVNVLATIDLADATAASGARDFVYPSTDKAVRPPSIYGATKRLAEIELLRRNRLASRHGIGIARLVNVFGTAGNVIEVFTRQMVARQPLTLTDPRMTRYWMTNREATLLLTCCACLDARDGTFMLEVGAPVPLTRTIDRLAALLDSEPPAVQISGLRPGERLEEELTYPDERTVSTGVPGMVRIVPATVPPDARTAVSELRQAVSIGDERRARQVLVEAVDARIPA